MADFNIKEIQKLKLKIQVVEKFSIAALILLVVGLYYHYNSAIVAASFGLILLQFFKWRFKKQLKQKEYLAKIVEERTVELRVQRDQMMEESEKLASALQALAEAQDELVRNERLATVGNLTKGLLDRILNPINYINNFATLSVELLKELQKNITEEKLAMTPELYDDTQEIIQMISSNLGKITDHGINTVRIVKAMEELLKDKRGNIVSADINDLCKVNLDIIAKLYKDEIAEKNIRINFHRLTLSLMVDMNIEQMGKLLLQLLHNSMYAILRKTDKQDFSPEINLKLVKQNSVIDIIVEDNGIGIEDSIKDKILEPFFTTKPTSEASGIGLYLCREIALNHKGTISVESEKDKYTAVKVTIPLYQNVESNG